MGETGFRLRTRDRAKAIELAKRGARALARLRSDGPAVAARYRAAQGELTSRANWARLFGLDA
jgi:galactofuranosylgalactofuranosylrhamnosyl-N-acetylglucosaminyl-diphospho-decaprenol beta-1,5/1,6-galactofuranosyltransferase